LADPSDHYCRETSEIPKDLHIIIIIIYNDCDVIIYSVIIIIIHTARYSTLPTWAPLARAHVWSSLVHFMTLKHTIILFHILNSVVFVYHIRIHEYFNGPLVFLFPFTFFFFMILKSTQILSLSHTHTHTHTTPPHSTYIGTRTARRARPVTFPAQQIRHPANQRYIRT